MDSSGNLHLVGETAWESFGAFGRYLYGTTIEGSSLLCLKVDVSFSLLFVVECLGCAWKHVPERNGLEGGIV